MLAARGRTVEPLPEGVVCTLHLSMSRLLQSPRRPAVLFVLAGGLVSCRTSQAPASKSTPATSTVIASPRPPAASTARTTDGADGCSVRATAIAVGGAHTCALLTDGTVRCWGANYRGQLGDGTTTFSSAPVRVEGLSDIVAIAAGDRHTCALRREGTVWCWGANDFGQLGKRGAAAGLASAFGFSPDKSTRPLAVAALADVIAIAAGETHVLALTKRGESVFWEDTTFKLLGGY
jgi:alpha-tubulin suppressor-like RCC1 family protein